GGGGVTGTHAGGNGGSGVVIIRYNDYSSGTWVSNNTSIATVSSAGVVTGVAVGTVTINLYPNCSPVASKTITVIPPSASSNSPVCVGTNLNLTATSGTSYSWTGPNSFSSTQQYPVINGATAAAAGTYTAYVGSASGTLYQATTIVVISGTVLTAFASQPTICGGESTVLSASASHANTAGFSGYFNEANWTKNTQIGGTINVASAPSSVSITCTNSGNFIGPTYMSITAPYAGTVSFNWSNTSPDLADRDYPVYGIGTNNAAYIMPGYSTSGSPNQSGTFSIALSAGQQFIIGVYTTNRSNGAATTVFSNFAFKGNVSYTWSPSAGLSSATGASVTATPSATSTYTVTIPAVDGCSVSATRTVTVNPGVQTVVNYNAPVCAGAPLNLTATGLSSNIYSWTGPNGYSSTAQNPVLAASTTAMSGMYTVNVSNGLCYATATVKVVVDQLPDITVSATPPGMCQGQSSVLSASFASPYTNNNVGFANDFAISKWAYATGPYDGQVNTDQAPASVWLSNGQWTTSGSAKMTITVPTTGTIIFTYNYTKLSSSVTYDDPYYSVNGVRTTLPGYVQNVYTQSGTVSVPVTAGQSFALGIRHTNSPNIGGMVTISDFVFSPSVSYSWSPSAGLSATTGSGVTATPSATSNYTVTATSIYGCTKTGTVSITADPVPVVNAHSNSPVCLGGTLNLSASGGVVYSWTGPNSFSSTAQNPVLTGAVTAMAGVYTVTVTTSGGCTITDNTTVTIDPTGAATITSNAPLCAGATLNLSVSSALSYSWIGPDGFSSSDQYPNITAANAANEGVYTVFVTGGNNCSSSATALIAINAVPSISFSALSGIICSGESTQLSASTSSDYNQTGFSGDYSPANWAISNASGGSVNTAGAPVSVTLTAPNNNVAANTNFAITIPKSGLLTFDWNYTNTDHPYYDHPQYVIDGVATLLPDFGYYNNNLQSGSVSIAVTAGQSFAFRMVSLNGTNGGSSTEFSNFLITDYATLAWSPSTGLSATTGLEVTASPTATTAYTVTATYSNGCTNTSSQLITVNPTPTATTSVSAEICAGNPISLSSLSVADMYAWSGPNGFTSNLQNPTIAGASSAMSGQYSLTVSSSSNCSSTATTNVVVNALPTISVTPIAPTICLGQSASLTAAGASVTGVFSASPNLPLADDDITTSAINVSGLATPLAAGTLASVCLNINHPNTDDLVLVLRNPDGNEILLSYQRGGSGDNYTNTCFSATATLPIMNGAAPFSGSFLPDEQLSNFDGINPNGVWTLIIDDRIYGNTGVLLDWSISFNNSPATYTWSPAAGLNNNSGPEVVATPIATTVYTVTGTNFRGCSSTATATVNVNGQQAVAASNSPVCEEEVLHLSASAGVSFTWSGPNGFSSTLQNPVITGVSSAMAGVYSVTVTEGTNCSSTTSTNVVVNSLPNLAITPANPVICSGQSVVLSSSGAIVQDVFTVAPNSQISDFNNISSTISVSGMPSVLTSGMLGSICLDINHPNLSDLIFELYAPNGNGLILSYKNGGSGDNFVNTCFSSSATDNLDNGTAPFTGSFEPDAPFSILNGSDPNGIWTLVVYDVESGNEGTLLNWSINFSNETPLSWSPTTGLSAATGASVTAMPTAPTTYTVTGTNYAGCTASASTTITVGGSTTWTGAFSTNWFDSQNWSGCMPGRYTDATIPAGLILYPILTIGNAETRNLTVEGTLSIVGGQIDLYGDFSNTGNFTNTGGSMDVLGSATQQIDGAVFNNLYFHTSGSKMLNGNATVLGQLVMNRGRLITGTDSLILAPTATITENDTSYVLGKVYTARVLSSTSENFGGMGVSILASQAPGLTKITRVTGQYLTGSGNTQSITRYFEIHPAVNTNLNATLTFTYAEHELNSIPESELAFFRSVNNGQSWTSRGYTSRDAQANT
ncbi:MAG: hypothetical protein EOP51_14095, partial [Sphingobacteriales bacterium]